MIEESYVSLDTAKLLKEVGFDVPCRGIYRAYRMGNSVFREYDRKNTKDDLCWNTEDGFQYEYLAPTQALAARWLREVHRIVVDATFIPPSTYGDAWKYFIGNMDDMVWNGDYEPSNQKYTTYEAALEDRLSYFRGNKRVRIVGQPYRDFNNSKQVIPQWQKDMAHWATKHQLYASCDFKDFKPRKGFKCKQYFK